jgi:hypothetical protein
MIVGTENPQQQQQQQQQAGEDGADEDDNSLTADSDLNGDLDGEPRKRDSA